MFDRKLADHLVIGDLDALVGRDATLIAAMTPQLQYRAGQPSATVRSIGTKKSPGLGVGASLDERKAGGLEGPSVHRINAHRADTVPTRQRPNSDAGGERGEVQSYRGDGRHPYQVADRRGGGHDRGRPTDCRPSSQST
jgi:hypothetical protein